MASTLKSCFYTTLIVSVLLITAGCSKKEAPKPAPIPTLKSTATFFVGASLNYNLLTQDTSYLSVVLNQFDAYSTDNGLTFDEFEPGPNQFDFKKADYMITFSIRKGKRAHVRNLIWNKSLPAWVLNFKGDSLAWENLFKTHIQTEVGRYRGQITSWDVVNEAVRDDDGSLRNQDVTSGDGSIWRQHLGPGYIARAFRYAHDADPLALLFYNDYGQEANGVKLDSIIALVTKLKNKGVPIDGVGVQLHINIHTNTDSVTLCLQKLAATGLRIHLSELSISVNPANDPNFIFTDSLQTVQAVKYQAIASTYIGSVPGGQRYGVTTRGVGDADNWVPAPGLYRRKDYSLVFDINYKKKPAYYGLMKGLQY